MDELQEHTENALNFAIRNEDTVDARAVLISACKYSTVCKESVVLC